jgi:hypothetical protein
MKSDNKNKLGKSSIQSMIRIAQISELGFNEILPKILMRETENIKKIKKKKQTNKKHTNPTQNKEKKGNTKN